MRLRIGSTVATLALIVALGAPPVLAAPPATGANPGAKFGGARAPTPRPARPWLGIWMRDDATLPGVPIRKVFAGSPAQLGGLQAGDMLYRIGQFAVRNVSEVLVAVRRHKVGQTIAIEIRRKGRNKTINVTLGRLPTYEDRLRKLLVGKPAPHFAVQKVGGTGPGTLTPRALKGKVVLLKFWAVWCGACIRSMPYIKKLHSFYAPRGLQIVAICKDRPSRVTTAAQRFKLPYTVAADARGKASVAFGINPIPSFVLVDKKGIVRDVAAGNSWAKSLGRLLGKMNQLLARP